MENGNRLLFIGAATLDAIALVDRFPAPDERVAADQVRFAGGGPAATAAVAAARLGVPASFIGAVGEDTDGERIVADLAAEGVDVSRVLRVPERPSGSSVVVVDRARGTRAICNQVPPELRLGGDVMSLVNGAAWVHVDQVGWGPVRRLLAQLPEDARPRLSVDAGNSIPGLDSRGVDLYVPTYAALTARYQADEPDPLARALEEGFDTVVATRGADGSVAATADGRRASAPGYRAELVSTLGAGDVFHGALLAAVTCGRDLTGQLRYANAAAALSCRGLDGRSAIPNDQEVLEFLSRHHEPTGALRR
jgi:sulfofructose kinase